jgi:hypothetical protein
MDGFRAIIALRLSRESNQPSAPSGTLAEYLKAIQARSKRRRLCQLMRTKKHANCELDHAAWCVRNQIAATKTNAAPTAKPHHAGPTLVLTRRIGAWALGDSKRLVFIYPLYLDSRRLVRP